VDNFAQIPGVPKDIGQTEKKWLDAADLVLVTSSFLHQKHSGHRPDLIQLPPGVDYELFSQAYSANEGRIQVQRVCFFGGMGAYWFDFDLVERIAEAGFRVSLIGFKAIHHRLFDHPNVEYTSSVPQAELPLLLKPMDALLIPYKLNQFTQGVFPTKVYECLATGKPLVATPLPDLQGELAKYIYLASDAGGFVDTLRRLPELETQERVQARLAVARKNSWKSRLDFVSRELERLLDG
jgi:glycosyltransferase involved in cell wall biosynthesis